MTQYPDAQARDTQYPDAQAPARRSGGRSTLHTVLLVLILILQIVTTIAALYIASMVADLAVMADDLMSQAENSLANLDAVTADAQTKLDAIDEAVQSLRSAVPFL